MSHCASQIVLFPVSNSFCDEVICYILDVAITIFRKQDGIVRSCAIQKVFGNNFSLSIVIGLQLVPRGIKAESDTVECAIDGRLVGR